MNNDKEEQQQHHKRTLIAGANQESLNQHQNQLRSTSMDYPVGARLIRSATNNNHHHQNQNHTNDNELNNDKQHHYQHHRHSSALNSVDSRAVNLAASQQHHQKTHWSSSISAKRNRLLNQLNQVELGRKKLELKNHKTFFESTKKSPTDQHEKLEQKQGVESRPPAQISNSKLDDTDHDLIRTQQHDATTTTSFGPDTDQSIGNNKRLDSRPSLDHKQKQQQQLVDDYDAIETTSGFIPADSDIVCGNDLCPANELHQQQQHQNQKQLLSKQQLQQQQQNLNSVSGFTDQLEMFVTSQVPPNKRVLCLIVRDNNNFNNNSNNANKQQQQQQQQQQPSRLNRTKSNLNPICYLFVQAIVDIEPLVSLPICQHQACHDKATNAIKANANAIKNLETTTTKIQTSAQQEQLMLPLDHDNQEGGSGADDEAADDLISISSSLSADLLFVENARAVNKNSSTFDDDDDDDHDFRPSTTTPDLSSATESHQQRQANVKLTGSAALNSDQATNCSLVNSFSDNDLTCIVDNSDNNNSPLVYPDHRDRNASAASFHPDGHHSIDQDDQDALSRTTRSMNAITNQHNKQSSSNTMSKSPAVTTTTTAAAATMLDQLFDNDLNQYTGAVGVVLSGKRRKKAKT